MFQFTNCNLCTSLVKFIFSPLETFSTSLWASQLIMHNLIQVHLNLLSLTVEYKGHFHKKGQITVKTFLKIDNGITNDLHFIFIANSLTRCKFM